MEKNKSCREQRQLSIYIHIPFCKQKCYYCDFLSACFSDFEIQDYFIKLEKEIREQSAQYTGTTVTSIFFGGGTPSYPDAELVCRILRVIKEELYVSPDAEISLEANPGTISIDKLTQYKLAGFNRLSIGLQSAIENELKEIGRIHTFREFLSGYKNARKAGFTNVNIDIMSALPGQTLETYLKTLLQVVELRPEHISAYSLIIEEGTVFWDRYHDDKTTNFPALPSEETEALMYEKTEEILKQHGYQRYEISNYAIPGKECIHNSVYWERKNYVGFGLGAASLYENKRWKNSDKMQEYLNKSSGKLRTDCQSLTREEQMEEFMFLGLRLVRGVGIENFQDTFGESIYHVYEKQIKKFMENHLLEENKGRIRLTTKGLDLSNIVMSEFLF